MQAQVDAQGLEATDVDGLHVGGGGLEDHLELEVLLDAVGILAVAAVGGAARGHDVRHPVRLGAQHPQERLGMHGSGAHFHVVRLLDDAALPAPEILQAEDDVLQRQARLPTGAYQKYYLYQNPEV